MHDATAPHNAHAIFYAHTTGLTALRTLRLDDNHLTSTVTLPPLPQLLELYLAGNRLAALSGLATAAAAIDVLDVSR